MEYLSADKPYFKGNLHLHTTQSDGHLSPEAAKARYQALGYDFIAITDHWAQGEAAHFYQNMLVLPGVELDFFMVGQVIHLLGIGQRPGILDIPRHRLGPQSAVNLIRELGGEAVLAHPAWSMNTTEVICGLKNLLAAEIYNGISAPPFSGDRADSMALLDVAAAQGSLLDTIATDDSHYYRGEEGRGFIRVQAADLSQQGIMAALRQGRYHASCGPEIHALRMEGDSIHISCSPVEHIIFLSNLPWAAERNRAGQGLTQASYQVKRGGSFPMTFVRVVLIDAQGRKAWSNPIPL